MGRIFKKLTAACLAGVLLTAGILTPIQPAQAAVKAWEKKNGKYYNSAGAVVPGVLAKGMDVSVWQGLINWDKVAASGQIEFAFIRVAHGSGLDIYRDRNLSEANRVGIPVGVYFYSEAKTVAQAEKDAQTTINAIKKYKITYPVVIDIEDDSQLSLTTTRRTKIVQAFADKVREAGYQPMIYCNTYWAKQYINMSGLQGVDAWIAEWAPNYTKSIPRDVWQVTDKGSVSGINGDVDLDFAFKQYGTSKPVQQDEWEKTSEGYRYKLSSGQYVKDQFKTIDSKVYYFNSSGYRVTGLQTIDGKSYYFNNSGVRQTGWKTIGGARYYFGKDGAMLKASWLKYKKNWYYLGKNGKMQTGWITVNKVRYYLDSSGIMQTQWKQLNGVWYYFKDSGAMASYEWVQWKGEWYFLKKSGQMKTSSWLNWKGNRYYLKSTGVMKVGWLQTKGKYYYFDTSGAMLRSTTRVIDGKSYTFNAKGVWVKK